MYPALEKDLQQLQHILHTATSTGFKYLDHISDIPTSVAPYPRPAATLPEDGHGAEKTLHFFREHYEHTMVASTGPRFWGFVTGGSTPAALAGDMLASMYDQNTQFNSGHGDVSGAVETETIKLLIQLLELPDQYLGGFVTGATMSNFTCLAVGRQWLGKKNGIDVAREGLPLRMPVISASPHSSAIKSLAMLGMGSSNIFLADVMEGNREAINISSLEKKIEALNDAPFILITSAGTVNTVDYDDMEAIASLRKKHSFWWHVDGAFGALAALSPQHKHLLRGWEEADSITVDCHKWLNVPYDNAFFLIRREHASLEMETFQNTNAPYLGDPLLNFSYLNFLPENSRRFRALPVWFSLKAYGKKGYQSIVEKSISHAQYLTALLEDAPAFELLAPTRLNNVCFTLRNANQETVKAFLSRLNDTGKVFMTPTVYKGRPGIRASFVNWRTEKSDIDLAFQTMTKLAPPA